MHSDLIFFSFPLLFFNLLYHIILTLFLISLILVRNSLFSFPKPTIPSMLLILVFPDPSKTLPLFIYLWASLMAQLVRIHLQCRRPGFDPWVGQYSGEGNGYLLQYSGLENSMNCIVHGVIKSGTRLSDFHIVFVLKYSLKVVF